MWTIVHWFEWKCQINMCVTPYTNCSMVRLHCGDCGGASYSIMWRDRFSTTIRCASCWICKADTKWNTMGPNTQRRRWRWRRRALILSVDGFERGAAVEWTTIRLNRWAIHSDCVQHRKRKIIFAESSEKERKRERIEKIEWLVGLFNGNQIDRFCFDIIHCLYINSKIGNFPIRKCSIFHGNHRKLLERYPWTI